MSDFDGAEHKGPARSSTIATSSGENRVFTLDTATVELLIVHIDVGQGESTLITERHNGNSLWTIVIDGGFAKRGRGPIGRYLQALGIKKVDALVCTHFDGDHTKGLTAFIKHHALGPRGSSSAAAGRDDDADSPPVKVKVSELLVRCADRDVYKSDTKRRLLEAAATVGIPIKAIDADKPILRSERVKITCVVVNHGDANDENAGSIGLLVEDTAGEVPRFRYFTAGDLPSSSEDELELGKLTAFKCGHHGSASSTSKAFIRVTEPSLAFISCGQQGFGHPSYDVIERLLAKDTKLEHVYLTNCIHNRRGVNPDYEEMATAHKHQYDSHLAKVFKLTKEQERGLSGTTYDEYIKKLVEFVPALKSQKLDGGGNEEGDEGDEGDEDDEDDEGDEGDEGDEDDEDDEGDTPASSPTSLSAAGGSGGASSNGTNKVSVRKRRLEKQGEDEPPASALTGPNAAASSDASPSVREVAPRASKKRRGEEREGKDETGDDDRSSPSAAGPSREQMQYAKAAWRAAMHHRQVLEFGRATVAGSETHLGTNVLRMDLASGRVSVGFWSGATKAWKWDLRCKAGAPAGEEAKGEPESESAEEILGRALSEAILTPRPSRTVPLPTSAQPPSPPLSKRGAAAMSTRPASPPTAAASSSSSSKVLVPLRVDTEALPDDIVNLPGSPTTKTGKSTATHDMLVKRLSDYKRFTELTITGLQRRKTGSPWFPFCNYCRRDCEEPLLNIYCKQRSCDSGSSYYHEDCYVLHMKKKDASSTSSSTRTKTAKTAKSTSSP